jgi:hypothetical protein
MYIFNSRGGVIPSPLGLLSQMGLLHQPLTSEIYMGHWQGRIKVLGEKSAASSIIHPTCPTLLLNSGLSVEKPEINFLSY